MTLTETSPRRFSMPPPRHVPEAPGRPQTPPQEPSTPDIDIGPRTVRDWLAGTFFEKALPDSSERERWDLFISATLGRAPAKLQRLYDVAVQAAFEVTGEYPAPPPAPPASLGERTAADLKFGPPPEAVLQPFLSIDPGEAMVLYGPGGAGKGTVAAWLLARYIQQDETNVAAILDWENHEGE